MMRFVKRHQALMPTIAIAALLAALGWQAQGRESGTGLRQRPLGTQNPLIEWVYPREEEKEVAE